jgi:hypothetical protein
VRIRERDLNRNLDAQAIRSVYMASQCLSLSGVYSSLRAMGQRLPVTAHLGASLSAAAEPRLYLLTGYCSPEVRLILSSRRRRTARARLRALDEDPPLADVDPSVVC